MVTRDGRGLTARSIGRPIAAAAICVVGVLAVASPANATVSCDYEQTGEALNVRVDSNAFVALGVASGQIIVADTGTPVTCSGTGAPPTVNNTGNINLFDDTNVSATWIISEPEDFVPGTGGTGEVETTVALAGGDDLFALLDQDGTADFWTLGAMGINWSGDNSREIAFFAPVDEVGFAGQDGTDALLAQGGQGTGNAFSGPATFSGLGGDGADDVWGGNSGDNLVGGSGDDELDGFAGGDALTGDTGTNELQGGSGDDRASYFSDVGVSVDLGVAGPQNTGVGIDTLSGVEGVEGTNEADVLTGNGDANALIGQDGNDVLDGRARADSLNGGADVDTATYASAPAGVNVDLFAGTATGGADNDTLTSIDDLIGSPFADTLIGDATDNSITGLGGNDTVSAEGGADAVRLRDGGPDTASCGTEVDTATADRASVDSVDPDCESVDFLPEDGGGGGGGGGPSNDFTFGKVKKNKRTGTAKLTVNVPGPGALELAKTETVKPDGERAEAEGSVKLLVKSKGRKRKKLRETGKAKVGAAVTYTPDGGDSQSKTKKVRLAQK
jgi:Ca2+-binding RTX toxin-like protein